MDVITLDMAKATKRPSMAGKLTSVTMPPETLQKIRQVRGYLTAKDGKDYTNADALDYLATKFLEKVM